MSWSSKLQGIVALLSTKAEYVAAMEAGKEVCWMRNLLFKMGFTSNAPSNLCIDNQSAIQVAKNLEQHSHMKQLDLKMFWLHNIVDQKIISLEFACTEHMPADILTKALPKVKSTYS